MLQQFPLFHLNVPEARVALVNRNSAHFYALNSLFEHFPQTCHHPS